MMPSLKRFPESAQQVANGVREAVLNSEVADFERFFDRVYVQEHQQVEDEREFYRNYVAGFEEDGMSEKMNV